MMKSLKIPHEKGVKRRYQKKKDFHCQIIHIFEKYFIFFKEVYKRLLGCLFIVINFQAFKLFIGMIPLTLQVKRGIK